ncbi:hypothetical protein FDU21_05520 [Xanthomonas oryzae pv. oryzae]|nr:hypothetical protein FDU21_05520 [Xanthomonas oryzae pv. oryzae]
MGNANRHDTQRQCTDVERTAITRQVISDGYARVKPSLELSAAAAVFSMQIASARNIQCVFDIASAAKRR